MECDDLQKRLEYLEENDSDSDVLIFKLKELNKTMEEDNLSLHLELESLKKAIRDSAATRRSWRKARIQIMLKALNDNR